MATYRFMTGTWYEVTLPDNKVDTEGYLQEDLYDAYFDNCLPEDVQVYEVEVDHIWDN